MNRISVALAGLMALALPSLSSAEVSVGISANSQGVNSFYMDIGNYFQVPQAQVEVVRQQNLPDDEAPVALFLAQQAHIGPDIIVKQRLAGRSWMSIALGLHLNAASFYLPLAQEPGGIYAPTYARFHVKRSRWGRIRLRDDEIVNLVNLRFATQHYGYRPEEVVAMRAQGRHFHEFTRRGEGAEHREIRRDERRDMRQDERRDDRREDRHDDRHEGERHDNY